MARDKQVNIDKHSMLRAELKKIGYDAKDIHWSPFAPTKGGRDGWIVDDIWIGRKFDLAVEFIRTYGPTTFSCSPLTPKVTFLSSLKGDWVAMYVDGKKVNEGHSLPYWEVLDQLGVKFEGREVDSDPYAADNGFPDRLEDLK